jgi:hypothetical protein
LVLDLVTPAEVDPMAGADRVVIVVRQDGEEIARAEGPIDNVEMPPLTRFGEVEVVVTARAQGRVLAAAYSGPVRVEKGDDIRIKALFLPINEPVRLAWTPAAHRIGHRALMMDDRRVLLVGGRQPVTNVQRNDSEWWEAEVGYDGLGPTLQERVSFPGVTQMADGSWLIAGGDAQGGPSRRVHRVTANGGTVEAVVDLSSASLEPAICRSDDLGALVFGDGPIEVYGPAGKVGVDASFLASGVRGCTTVGRQIVTAGNARNGWGILDLAGTVWPVRFSSVWRPLAGVPDLDGPLLTTLPDGRVWIGGGYGFAASPVTRLVEPSTGRVTVGPDLADPRVDGLVAPWREEWLVIAGGFRDDVRAEPVRSLAIHHPEDGPVLDVSVPLRGATPVVLPGGAVLYTGGLDEDANPAGAWAVIPWVEEE